MVVGEKRAAERSNSVEDACGPPTKKLRIGVEGVAVGRGADANGAEMRENGVAAAGQNAQISAVEAGRSSTATGSEAVVRGPGGEQSADASQSATVSSQAVTGPAMAKTAPGSTIETLVKKSAVGKREGDGGAMAEEKRKVVRGGVKKGKREVFVYGNYRHYYGYRLGGQGLDPRLAAIDATWVEGKRVLDIGCNSGLFTLQVARKKKPARILGIDIDADLVDQARRNLRKSKGKEGPMPCSVAFTVSNFVEDEKERAADSFDCIMCMSVSKWIHLNWGDEGLLAAFRSMHRLLCSGGVLVLEVQPWSSYKKKHRLSEDTKKHFKAIQIMPDQFGDTLESLGFSVEIVEPPEQTQGFERPIYKCVKL